MQLMQPAHPGKPHLFLLLEPLRPARSGLGSGKLRLVRHTHHTHSGYTQEERPLLGFGCAPRFTAPAKALSLETSSRPKRCCCFEVVEASMAVNKDAQRALDDLAPKLRNAKQAADTEEAGD